MVYLALTALVCNKLRFIRDLWQILELRVNGTGLQWMGRLRLVNVGLIDTFALSENSEFHDT